MFGPSLLTVSLALLAGIFSIVVLSTRFKMHPFFSLTLACFITGALGSLEGTLILSTMKEGFGKIMSSLGFIIVVGTALGMVLQASGATTVMANTIIRWVGQGRSVFAISLTGFIVGLPIFCDSGYIVLNGLNKSMIRKTGTASIIMSTALATGLYAVHCFIPPHPGITAAVGTLNADFGWAILYGLLVAIPAMLTGYGWAIWKGKKFPDAAATQSESVVAERVTLPGAWMSFIPVLVPIVLIGMRAVLMGWMTTQGLAPLLILGDPAIALTIGLILAFCIPKKWARNELNQLMHQGVEKAGGILVIIGAGSAFGMVIGALKIQDYLVGMDALNGLGLFFPFIIAVILKTAQGSSTVAVLTTASIVLPFLPGLQLDTENGRLLSVLAMGAGSMAASHVNDSYFWVIANFSDLELKPMLSIFSMATFLMALAGMLAVYILSLFIL